MVVHRGSEASGASTRSEAGARARHLFLILWYYLDAFTGARCTRKVVVDERILDDPTNPLFGIVRGGIAGDGSA